MNPQNGTDHPDIIAFPPAIFIGCVAISGLLHLVLPLRMMWYPAALVIGIVLALVSLTLGIWAERVMKATGTNVRPNLPSLKIVSSGPYRFTRNPMYLSLCLLQLAWGFLLNDWIPLAFAFAMALVLHFGVILREEKYLESKFGEEYVTLKQSVRRWI